MSSTNIQQHDKKEEGEANVEVLKKLLDEERKKSEDYLTRLKYLQADFENYLKRVKREIEETVDVSKGKLIQKLLDVVDNLELALKIGLESKNLDALIRGVELTLNEFKSILEEEGLTSIKALGEKFNPNIHEAVGHVEVSNSPEDVVVEELRKGYMFKGKVIRPAMVKISKLKS
ncbi:MAG: nucleotide exchange factor GrpE [Candidatus Bathyarchaeota archaeon]|nr:nucleotide exchange factor GrpE [Candidatus Bathyarchaeota archaeon]